MFLRMRGSLPWIAALALGLTGFAAGFIACLHLKGAPPQPTRQAVLTPPGNAPPAARDAVLESLRALQYGYTHRDPTFMSSLSAKVLPADGDILVLGTEGGPEEWARGPRDTERLIAADWQYWGDVRLDVDHALVWSAGNVAWVATLGSVHWKEQDRSLRFTAILTHENDRWVFRQMHYQWNDHGPVKADLWHLRTYEALLHDAARLPFSSHN